jgi:hypothetical protein
MWEPNRAKASAAYSESSLIGCCSLCDRRYRVWGGTSLAMEHSCHSFQARLWVSWTPRCCCRRAHRSVGGLMIRAESPARNTRPAGTVLPRATWSPMLNPRILRSVPGIWGRSLTSTPRAGRLRYEPSRRRPALVRLVVFDRLVLGIVAGAEDPLLSPVFITRLKIGYVGPDFE